MNKKIAIAIPSKNRPFGDTFKFIKKAKCPVYVYVEEREAECYKTYLPENCQIITHNFDWIGKIRQFITEHQKELGNIALVLDDDITAFCGKDEYQVDINYVIDEILNYKEDYDIMLIHSDSRPQISIDIPRSPTFWVGIAYALNLSFSTSKVRFSEKKENIGEDIDAYLQVVKYKLKIARPSSILVYHDYNKNSRFERVWRLTTEVGLYEKWGMAYSLLPTHDERLLGCFIKEEFADKVVYSAVSNKVIEDVIEENKNNPYIKEFLDFASAALERIKQKPLDNNPIRDRRTHMWAKRFHPELFKDKIKIFEDKENIREPVRGQEK